MALFKKKKTEPAPKKSNSRFQMSATCQVPNLDALYERYFGERPGTFVEVGAFDGEYASNTSGLARLGWRGYYVEPVKEYYSLCAKRYKDFPNISVHNVGIAESEGIIRLKKSGPLSTASKVVEEKFKSLEWSKELVKKEEFQEVQTLKLDTFLETNQAPKGFELLVVDVEGFEKKVFDGFSLEAWKPKILIVELHDQNPDYKEIWDDCAAVYRRILKAGYVPVFKDFSNTVAVYSP